MRYGKRVRITLTDGSTLEGTLRFSWGWWAHRLTSVGVQTQQGQIEAEGSFYVPRRSVLFVQVVGG